MMSSKTATIDDHYVAAWNILDESEKDGEIVSGCERREFCTDDIAHGFYMNNPGGIWRSVRLIISDKIHIDECFFVPSLKDATIQVQYSNSGVSKKEVQLS